MKIKPVVHHHFDLSKAILLRPERCNQVSFESIPLFKIYQWHSLEHIRRIIEARVHPMPHAYQKTYNKIRPANLECRDYREDSITLKFCKHNRQEFFVRAYYLKQNGGKFLKVEVTMHSDTLSEGKHFSWQKSYQGAFNFFQLIDKQSEALSPLDLHQDDYFFPEVFEKEVSVLQDSLNVLRDYNKGKVRDALIEKFKEQAMSFQLEAKSNACIYISSLKNQATLDANLFEWRQPEF